MSQEGGSVFPDPVTPEDLIAAGLESVQLAPRAAVGALSVALGVSAKPEGLKTDLDEAAQELSLLAQDPRPVEEKLGVIAGEVRTSLQQLAQVGDSASTEAASAVNDMLPEELKQFGGLTETATTSSASSTDPQSSTTTTYPATVTGDMLASQQTASSVAVLVQQVREARDLLAPDVLPTKMWKVKVVDAAKKMRFRLEQLLQDKERWQGTDDAPALLAAIGELESLVAELESAVSEIETKAPQSPA
eukprot:scaffold44_cov411-Prasinococcus_capsulatus_cf.AAC.43